MLALFRVLIHAFSFYRKYMVLNCCILGHNILLISNLCCFVKIRAWWLFSSILSSRKAFGLLFERIFGFPVGERPAPYYFCSFRYGAIRKTRYVFLHPKGMDRYCHFLFCGLFSQIFDLLLDRTPRNRSSQFNLTAFSPNGLLSLLDSSGSLHGVLHAIAFLFKEFKSAGAGLRRKIVVSTFRICRFIKGI